MGVVVSLEGINLSEISMLFEILRLNFDGGYIHFRSAVSFVGGFELIA